MHVDHLIILKSGIADRRERKVGKLVYEWLVCGRRMCTWCMDRRAYAHGREHA